MPVMICKNGQSLKMLIKVIGQKIASNALVIKHATTHNQPKPSNNHPQPAKTTHN